MRLVPALVLVLGCAISVSDDYADELWTTAENDQEAAELEDASLLDDPTEPPLETDDSADPAELDEPLDDVATLALAATTTYKNPVHTTCADPGVVRTVGADGNPLFHAACTGNGYPRFKSTNLLNWTATSRIFSLATKPTWTGGNNWAPEIHAVGDGFIAYYSALSPSRGRSCIGAARASSINGPWTDIGRPLVCDVNVGLIDVHMFTDASGKHILYYKTEGNALSPQQPTIIYGHELTPNGIGFVGTRKRLLTNTLAWEGDVVEAPWVIQRGRYYYLFYSGFRYCNKTYGVGVARSLSPLGPFRKRSAPILRSNSKWVGPGHNSTVRAGGKLWMVYHAWDGAHECGQDGGRKLLLDRIGWSGGWPFVEHDGTPSIGVRNAPGL